MGGRSGRHRPRAGAGHSRSVWSSVVRYLPAASIVLLLCVPAWMVWNANSVRPVTGNLRPHTPAHGAGLGQPKPAAWQAGAPTWQPSTRAAAPKGGGNILATRPPDAPQLGRDTGDEQTAPLAGLPAGAPAGLPPSDTPVVDVDAMPGWQTDDGNAHGRGSGGGGAGRVTARDPTGTAGAGPPAAVDVDDDMGAAPPGASADDAVVPEDDASAGTLAGAGSVPLFPPGVTLDDPAPTGRHIAGGVQSWAAEQLDTLFGKTARILEEYPAHIQDLVKAMPAHRFKEIRNAREHYVGVKPIVPPESPDRSAFVLSTRYGANSATASNVCYDRRKKKVILYRGSARNVLSSKDRDILTKVGHAGFKWTWKFEEASGAPPKSARWYKGMTVLASPAFAKHTTHFSEAVTFLFHAALHPRVYPWWGEAKRVLHVKVTKKKDYPWSHAFMRAVMTGLPDHDKVDLIWSDQMQSGTLHCFERAGFMAQQTHEYGYHADPWEAQLFREATFKLYDVPEPPRLKPNQKIRTTVLGRKGRKKMVNVKQVISVIKQTELAKFDYLPSTASQPVYFEKDTTFKDQITVMRFTDVLVGLHGSGLNNAMFMEPGSVVIAIMPSNYIEYEWHNFLTGSGITYLIQANTDNKKHSANCRQYPSKCDRLRPFQAKTKECVPMWYCDAKVDVGATEVLFRQTNFLIRNMKREMPKLHHAMKFGGGRNPAGKVTKLDE